MLRLGLLLELLNLFKSGLLRTPLSLLSGPEVIKITSDLQELLVCFIQLFPQITALLLSLASLLPRFSKSLECSLEF